MMFRVVLFFLISICKVLASDVAVDKDTGLMWQDDPIVTQKVYNYQGAQKYCDDLKLSGYIDWRLPHIDELISITDKRFYRPAIKVLFIHFSSEWYWSNTEFLANKNKAWLVNFFNGSDDYRIKREYAYVRCVRTDI